MEKPANYELKDIGDYYMVPVGSPKFDITKDIREWWFSIYRLFGHFSCYSIFLLLPSDVEAIKYFSIYKNEIDTISGKLCLILVFTNRFQFSSVTDSTWNKVIQDHIEIGSTEISDYFGVPITDFPCFIIFEDIRSPKHLELSLKGLTAEDIAIKMREIIAVVGTAVSNNISPLNALYENSKNEKLRNAGSTIIKGVRGLAGKSFEAFLEVWFKNMLP